MLMALFFVATIFSATAQDDNMADVLNAGGKTPQEKSENQAKKLTEKLVLNAAQTTQVQAALLDRITKIQTVRSTVEKGGGKRKEAIKVILVEFDTKMKTILTPEQYTKFEQLREDKKEKMKEKRQDHKGHNHGEKETNEGGK